MAAAVVVGSSIVSILLRRNRKRALLKSAAGPKYTVILKSPGESMSDTVRRLRSVIPVKPYEAERIIRTIPVMLQDGVDAGTANQTRQALEKAGAVVEVLESASTQPMMVYTKQGLESAIDTIQSRYIRWMLKYWART
jgi:ribosomal protein L7/L12